MEHFYSRKLSYHCLLSLFGHPQCSTLFSKTIYATNCCSISLRSFSENFQLSRIDSSLIHQSDPRWIWHLFWTYTKAFGAITPSSVISGVSQETGKLKTGKKVKERKWEWRHYSPHFHFETQESFTSGKNNVSILQLFVLPASAPPLTLNPANTEAWRPPHLAQRPMILARSPLSNPLAFFKAGPPKFLTAGGYQCSTGFLSRDTSFLGKEAVVDDYCDHGASGTQLGLDLTCFVIRQQTGS